MLHLYRCAYTVRHMLFKFNDVVYASRAHTPIWLASFVVYKHWWCIKEIAHKMKIDGKNRKHINTIHTLMKWQLPTPLRWMMTATQRRWRWWRDDGVMFRCGRHCEMVICEWRCITKTATGAQKQQLLLQTNLCQNGYCLINWRDTMAQRDEVLE